MPQQKAGGGLLGKVSRTPAASPTLPDQSIAVRDCSTKTARVRETVSPLARRHWNRKPRFTLSDAVFWALFTLVVGTALIAVCVVLTLGWPR